MKNIVLLFVISFTFIACNTKPLLQTEEPFDIVLAAQSTPSTIMKAAPLVPPNAQIILIASTLLDTSTVNANTVLLRDASGTDILVKVLLNGTNITLSPITHLEPFNEYTITVTTALHDQKGQHLNQNKILTFQTEQKVDFIGPSLVTTLPINGGNADAFTDVYLQFDEPISPLYFNSSDLIVLDGSIEIPGTVTLFGSLISYTPDSPFTAGSITVALNTTSLYDLAGNPYNGTTSENINFSINTTATTTQTKAEMITPYPLQDIAYNIVSTGNTLFVGGENGLEVFTYTTINGLTSHVKLSAETVGSVYSMELNTTRKRLYIASSDGFRILDISQLQQPKIISRYTHINDFNNIVPVYGLDIVNNSYAYLAASSSGLIALDITQEQSPQVLYIKDTNGTAFDVASIDGTLILADFDQGTKLFNRSDGAIDTPPTQQEGQDRRLYAVPILDLNNDPSHDYYVAAGIGGIKNFDGYQYTTNLNTDYQAGYVSEVIYDGVRGYANVLNVGIKLQYGSYGYLLLDHTATTIGYLYDENGQEYLVTADTDAYLHMYEVP